MENLTKKKTELSPQQLAILKEKLNKRARETKVQKITPYVSEDGLFPLSYSQERILHADRDGEHVVMFLVKLTGVLHVEALEKSFNEIRKYHQILSSTIYKKDNKILGRICQHTWVPLEKVEMGGHLSSKKDLTIHDLADETWNTPLDVEQGPLLKSSLIKVGEKEHYLFMKAHQLVFDSASIGIFLKSLSYVYENLLKGETPVLKELPVQFAHYAYWQREILQKETYEKSLTYWMKKINQAPIHHENQTQSGSIKSVDKTFIIPSELVNEIKNMTRREGVTLFMVLLAAFNCLLSKVWEQEEVLVGSTVENRNRVEVEDLIGPFETTIAFLVNLSGNPNFREILYRVRDEVLETYSYQDIPIEMANTNHDAEWLPSKPIPSRAMLLLNTEPSYQVEISDLNIDLAECFHDMPAKDIILSLKETDGGLQGKIKCNQQIYDEQTTMQIADSFLYVLKEVTKNPSIGLCDLKVNTSCESPHSEVEQNLVNLWKEVLHCDRVGINENFFDIGGNSLMLVRLHEKIEAAYPGKVTIAKLFSYPTISKLAGFIEGDAENVDLAAPNVPISLLPLPLDYFLEEDEDNEDIALKFRIPDEVRDNILLVSRENEISTYDVLLAIYIYLLSETASTQQITVQTTIDESGMLVYPLNLDLQNITDFSQLFKMVNQRRTQVKEEDTYPLKLAGSMKLDKSANSVMTMFSSHTLSKTELLENYDILIKVSDDNEGIVLTCEYNAVRLRKSKMEELVLSYKRLIEILIERMI